VPELSIEHQPRAQAALNAALAAGPSHAYLFRGPRGAGKRELARAFAAEILATGAADPDDARRRALLDPSPHPDLVWIAPRGAQHLVEEVRERVIRAVSYRPFEGERRVFVIEDAEAMRDESQNALLKTLEEPPGFAHLILLSAEPAALLETIVSRCQPVELSPLPADAVEAALAGQASPEELAAAARLAGGDLDRARFLLSDPGRALRAAAQGVQREWRTVLDLAALAGEEAEEATRRTLDAEAEAGVKRSNRELADAAKRVGRRRRTEVLDLGLELEAAWLRDLAAVAAGAEDVVFNSDRLADLRARAAGTAAADFRRAAEQVQDTRRRLDLNVSEELALEALSFRLASVLA
jgi:DNA polymerase-3 subunit delta'